MRLAAVGAAVLLLPAMASSCAPPYGGETEWHRIGAQLRGANVVEIPGRPGWYSTGQPSRDRASCEYTLNADTETNSAIVFEVCGSFYAWQQGSLGYRS